MAITHIPSHTTPVPSDKNDLAQGPMWLKISMDAVVDGTHWNSCQGEAEKDTRRTLFQLL
jgi:hypothetical protein